MLKTRLPLLAAALALCSAGTTAAPRSQARIRQAAAAALQQHYAARHQAPRTASELRTLAATDHLTVVGYADRGFAVIANDDLMPELLAVSDSRYSGGQNTNMRWWQQAVEQVAAYAAANGIQMTTTAPDPTLYPTQVGPLMTTEWDQDTPYNNLCPTFSGSVRCLTGCVATAMAQVLNYFETPVCGIGQRTIYYPHGNASGEAVTATFADDYYDWDNMLDSYSGNYTDEQAQAVALLMRDCGVAADMEYGGPAEGSGAYSQEAAAGLRQYFGFSEAQCLERDYYDEATWMDKVYRELSETGPIYYGGGDSYQGGHAFVLHGYRADGKVYVNWGWSGDDDGYYDIALLNPAYYAFQYGQDMIIGVKGEPRQLDTLTVSVNVPGQLAAIIGDDRIGNIGVLTLSGSINSSDLLTLRRMGGIDEHGEKTDGFLQELDLSQCRIVGGGHPYLIDGSRQLTTADDALPERAFCGMKHLRRLVLPAGLKSYGDGALAHCTKLGSVQIGTPDAEASFSIEDNVVWNADRTQIIAVLPSATGVLEIARGTTALRPYALAGCARLSKVVVPATVETIGREALSNCVGLQEIRMAAETPPELTGANVFSGITFNSCLLRVPSGSKPAYTQKAQWGAFQTKQFDNIVEYGSSVKVRNTIRYYGEQNPTFTYTVSGDPISGEPELSCEATPASPAGRYPVRLSMGTITDETVRLIDGYLVVQKVNATATVNDCSREAGQPNPEFTLSYDGLVAGDTVPVWTAEPVITTTATTESPAGEYPIVVESGTAESYKLSFVAGTLTVTEPAAIHAVAAGSKADGTTYDMQGRRVEGQPAKGLYIVGGRKKIVGSATRSLR